MNTDELQAIVDAVGEGEVSKALDWSRWTLRRKLAGKSRIDKAEAFTLQALAAMKGGATTGTAGWITSRVRQVALSDTSQEEVAANG